MGTSRTVKRRKLSPPDESSSETLQGSPIIPSKPYVVNSFYSNAARWNLEQEYEHRPRKLNKKEQESTRLPVISTERGIKQIEKPGAIEEDNDSNSWLDSEGAGSEDEVPTKVTEPQKPIRQQIIEAKEELARLALQINQDPEENAGAFKGLAELANSPNITIKKLALATQMTVFKDIIPGYRIRPLGDKDMSEKVSKEVKKLRNFEQSLVRTYQNYVKELARCAKRGGKGSTKNSGLDTLAITCACELLLAVPHFNFRGELLQIVVAKLSHRKIDDYFTKCRETIERLFDEDDGGNASLDAVTTITRMMKARNYNIDESVLNTLLHLRLLTEFSFKASQNAVDKPQDENGKTKQQKKKEYLSKKQRKALRELKAVEKDFKEADAIVSHEERDKNQAETLKIVFATYFKILKARSPHLTGAVLEGLAKFAHLVNQDFFGDLLEVLKELAYKSSSYLDREAKSASQQNGDDADDDDDEQPPSDPARITLLCTTTAFTLLSAQDLTRLSLDLSSFNALLYKLLLPTLPMHPDLELSHKTFRLSDPHTSDSLPSEATKPKINVATTSTLLLRALSAALTDRSTPQTRLASFTHRLMTASLHMPEKTARATIGLLEEIARTQGRKINPLWNSEERRGDGEFDPLGDMETCRPFCGSVWEGELLRYHFSEGVRDEVKDLNKLVAGL
jgi:nucleolar complex protein 3